MWPDHPEISGAGLAQLSLHPGHRDGRSLGATGVTVGHRWGVRDTWPASACIRGGTNPEITMRYVSRYLSHNTYHGTSLMLRLIDYQVKIKEA